MTTPEPAWRCLIIHELSAKSACQTAATQAVDAAAAALINRSVIFLKSRSLSKSRNVSVLQMQAIYLF